MQTDRPWWRSWSGVPKRYERWNDPRLWDEEVRWSAPLASVAVAAILMGGVAVLSGSVEGLAGVGGIAAGTLLMLLSRPLTKAIKRSQARIGFRYSEDDERIARLICLAVGFGFIAFGVDIVLTGLG